MRQLLKLALPYEQISGFAEIAIIQDMNEIQKRITAMILNHEELEISSMTIKEAVQKVFNIKDFNYKVIEEDVKELINKNTNLLIEIDDAIVSLIELAYNNDIKEKVFAENKFNILGNQTRRINTDVFAPYFHGFKIEHEVQNSKVEPVPFNKEISYDDNQRLDIISELNHKQVSSNETIKLEELKKEIIGSVIWRELSVKLEILEKEIKTLNSESEIIIRLISENKLEYNIEKIMNSFIDDRNLKPIDGDEIDYNEFKNIVDKLTSHTSNEFPFQIVDKEIISYGYKIKTLNLNGKEIKFKYPVFKVEKINSFIDKNASKIDKNFLNMLSKKNDVLKFIIDNDLKLLITNEDILELVNYNTFIDLEEKTIKRLLSNKMTSLNILFKYKKNLKPKDIFNIKRWSNLSFEDVIKASEFKYSEPLFNDWDAEKKMFLIINKINSLGINNTKSELQKYYNLFDDKSLGILSKQKIILKAKYALDKKVSNAEDWNIIEIVGHATSLRQKLEDETLKWGDISEVFLDRLKGLNKNKSKRISSIYKELSNDYIHRQISNPRKSEANLKKLILEVNELLPLVKEDFKGEKNVT